MTGSSPRPRGKCSECGEHRCLRGDGTVGAHRKLYAKHYRMGYQCGGVGKPPAPEPATPVAAAEIVDDPYDVQVVPRIEIFAVRPGPAGSMIHLFSPGYRPGAKGRSCVDTSALCGPSVHPLTDDRVTPLPDALGWTEPHQHTDGCHTPAWRWCRPCLGHAATIAGLASETAIAIAERQRPTARGAP